MVYAKFQFAMTKSPFTNKPQSLFVTGGWGSSGAISSAEILTENGWEEFFPSFPANIKSHCMVLLNSTTVIVVGGVQNTFVSADTYLISDDKKVKFDHFLQNLLINNTGLPLLCCENKGIGFDFKTEQLLFLRVVINCAHKFLNWGDRATVLKN
jgi:hypothetical protein